jgi:hypothetical protein
MSSLICKCGKEKASTQKKICDDCRTANKKEKSKLDARKHRATHGSAVKNRSLLCSRCKGIKEHQERGYCLACERERYQEKDKPDCFICGATKENIRDAYCRKCKNTRMQVKSLVEGRRFKNDEGRKLTCSNCGREKEETYLNESYCRNCKMFKKKLHRPYRTDEQRLKEAVRRVTSNKIKQGHLIRLPCEVCCTDVDVHAHHDDYSKPLNVRWLCRKHHQEYHRNNP